MDLFLLPTMKMILIMSMVVVISDDDCDDGDSDDGDADDDAARDKSDKW